MLSEWAVRTPLGFPETVVSSIVDAHSTDLSLASCAVWLFAACVGDPVAEYVVRAPAMMLVGMGLYRLGVINAGRDAA